MSVCMVLVCALCKQANEQTSRTSEWVNVLCTLFHFVLLIFLSSFFYVSQIYYLTTLYHCITISLSDLFEWTAHGEITRKCQECSLILQCNTQQLYVLLVSVLYVDCGCHYRCYNIGSWIRCWSRRLLIRFFCLLFVSIFLFLIHSLFERKVCFIYLADK